MGGRRKAVAGDSCFCQCDGIALRDKLGVELQRSGIRLIGRKRLAEPRGQSADRWDVQGEGAVRAGHGTGLNGALPIEAHQRRADRRGQVEAAAGHAGPQRRHGHIEGYRLAVQGHAALDGRGLIDARRRDGY